MKNLLFAARSTVSSRKPEIIFIATVTVVLLVLALGLRSERTGDGHYYFAMLKALAENCSPAITESIRAEVSAEVGPTSWRQEARAANGLNYGDHFFAYPLAAVPAYKILQVFATNSLKAFQLTNAFIEIALLCYLLLYCKSSAFVRWVVAALFLLSTGSIYFQWTGPEVFTAALVLAASMGFVERRYAQAALLTAAASLQNPSAVFLLAFIGLGQILELVSEFRESGLNRRVAGQMLGLLVAGLVVVLPYAWSYWKFGVFNPIVARAIDYSLISLSRLTSLFFDLNQGMIVGLPWLILAVPAALFTRLLAWIRLGQILFRPEDWLLMAVVLMSIPVLAQVNWNPGQSVFIRYAAWIAMPVVAWVAVTLNQVSVDWRQLIMIPALGAQVAMVLVVGGISIDRFRYVSFQPWVPALWAAAPGIYNPVPEIFFERTVGQERAIQTPAFYSPGNGRFLKILTKSDNLDEASNELCGEQGQLRPESSKWGSGPYVSAAEKGYFYISGHLRCTYSLPFELSFTSAHNLRLEMRGWTTPESHGTWNAGGLASIRIPLDTVPAGGVRVIISGTAFVNERLSTQFIQINAGRQEINSWATRFPQHDIAREFVVKSDQIGDDALLILDFLFPNATSPAQLGLSGDTRQLSMALHSIRVDPISTMGATPK